MASFVIGTASTTAQTLANGESGMIQQTGSLTPFSGNAVTMAGGAALGVQGSLAALGAASAVLVSGSNSSIMVGAQGSILGLGGAAIESQTGNIELSNSGEVTGESFGMLLGHGGEGSARIVNSGVIRGLQNSGIYAHTDVLTIVNTGEITGGISGIQAFARNVTIQNMGIISSIAVSELPLSSCYILNTGTIAKSVSMSAGNDRFIGDEGLVFGPVMGRSGDDRILTDRGDNEVLGGFGNDRLITGQGDDTLFGDEGADSMMGGLGADFHDGGAGRDQVDYRDSTAGVEVDLRIGEGAGGWAEGDQFVRIETILGSGFADVLTGDASDNLLRGRQGGDRLDGGDGDDTLRGDGGADTILGGAGSDTVTYAGSQEGIVVNLSSSSAATGGQAQGDVLTSIENVIGSEGADLLTGTTGANRLTGGGGGDLLNGLAGSDTLTGGAGADTFHFIPWDGTDTITDFQIGLDKLNLVAFGFTSLAQLTANLEISDDGTDTYLNFTNLNIDSLIILQDRLFASEAAFAASVIYLGPI